MPFGQSMVGSPGPGGQQTPNPGLAADATSKVREAVHLLELALPGLPSGSDEHAAVIGAISKLSKIAPAHKEQEGIDMSTLMALAGQAKQSAAMRGMMGGGMGGGGEAPQAGPPMMPGM